MSGIMLQNTQGAELSLVGTTRNTGAWGQLLDELLLRSNRHLKPSSQDSEICHADIISAAAALRSNITSTLGSMIASWKTEEEAQSPSQSVRTALDVAIQSSFMTEAGLIKKHTSHNRLAGTRWDTRKPFLDFMETNYFQHHNSEGIVLTSGDQNALKAWKLMKKLGIELKGTNNLADHLWYSRQSNTLYFFHHVGFLIAHLGCRAYDIPLDSDMKFCLKRGTLPPRLLFETLHSIQSILFPSMDLKAHKMMEQLVKKQSLDPECNHYSGYMRKDFQVSIEEVSYRYWGVRLLVLRDLLRERPPKTKWEKWLQWQSSETNAFAIAILALLISIVVGLVSIGLSIFQVWIAWMAWKHPVN